MRAGASQPIPSAGQLSGSPQAKAAKIPQATAKQRHASNVVKPAPSPTVDCIHRGDRVGTLRCNCQNKPVVYGCSIPGYCGYAIEHPTTQIVDGPIIFTAGHKSDLNFLPWQLDDTRGEIPPLIRMPVCSLCDRRVPLPTVEIINPEARVQLVSGYTSNYREIGELTAPTLREYAQRHNHGLRLHTGGFEIGYHASWSKIVFTKQAFSSGADVVFWIDSDAAVTNQTITLDSLLSFPEELVLANDPWGINCGVWLLRRSSWSDRFLSDVWSARNTTAKLWDQDTIQDLLDAGRLNGHYRLVYPRLLNAIPSRPELRHFHWRPGDFICHSTGANGTNRLPWLRSAIAATLR